MESRLIKYGCVYFADAICCLVQLTLIMRQQKLVQTFQKRASNGAHRLFSKRKLRCRLEMKNNRLLEKGLSFLAVFIDQSTKCKKMASMKMVPTLYSDIVADAAGDTG